MVKYRDLILKYSNSGLPNYGDEDMNEMIEGQPSASSETVRRIFLPEWRRRCDEWVDTRLEERQGVVTPVSVLYNTFLQENPNDYMDIAQFGKVLKSKFRNHKCRRGGQGAQIYVYKNVAIKDLESTVPQVEDLTSATDVTSASSQTQSSKKKNLRRKSALVIGSFQESCRMAIGRKWVDTHIRHKAGARVFAWEVAAAYSQAHPEEPLTDTSLTVLLRSKFPSRRKSYQNGSLTSYYFQDLEIVNSEEYTVSGYIEDLLEYQVNPSTAMEGIVGAGAAIRTGTLTKSNTFLRSTEDGRPLAVVNPPAETVFMYQGVPCVALDREGVILDKPNVIPSNIESLFPCGKGRQDTFHYGSFSTTCDIGKAPLSASGSDVFQITDPLTSETLTLYPEDFSTERNYHSPVSFSMDDTSVQEASDDMEVTEYLYETMKEFKGVHGIT